MAEYLSSYTGEQIDGAVKKVLESKTVNAVIGTSWTENEDNSIKTQIVNIEGITADHTAKIDHVYTGDGSPESCATFVEEENQYLTYITNGYAKTHDGCIIFYIFGDAPTVEIPIVVEVT